MLFSVKMHILFFGVTVGLFLVNASESADLQRPWEGRRRMSHDRMYNILFSEARTELSPLQERVLGSTGK